MADKRIIMGMLILTAVSTVCFSQEMYQIQVGAFKDFEKAQLVFERLRTASFNAVYEKYLDFTRVVIREVRADDLADYTNKLRLLGYYDLWIRGAAGFSEIYHQDGYTGLYDEVNWNGHRYRRIEQGKTWIEAKAYCETLGGHLAAITSAEEQATVYNLIAAGDKNVYWIGGRLIGNDWVWVTGEQWAYTNWAAGEPNHDGPEEYLQMYSDNSSSLKSKWNDGENIGDGSSSFYFLENTGFVCEWD